VGGAHDPAVFPLGRKTRAGAIRERDLLEAVAGYWTAGGELDWAAFRSARGRRTPLATYPYQRDRHWIDPAPAGIVRRPPPGPGPVAEAGDTGDTGGTDEITVAVRHIWRELIGHDRFSAEDNFLELGGNSLTAVQMLTRLRDRFGVKLSLHALFDSPTVTGIAGLVSGGLPEPADR
jgi:phthiocerol/phenolphthiocerol synthesis type-I polyketide synthase E